MGKDKSTRSKGSKKGQAQDSVPEDAPSSLVASPIPRQPKDLHPWLSVPAYKELIPRCQHLEKRVFPKSEAMDLASELKKPNQFLFVVLRRTNAGDIELLAYGVLAL
ncbi:hypothetical protein EC988_007070, partial [Linderina pennispora]